MGEECPVCFAVGGKSCRLAPFMHSLCLGCAKRIRRCPLCRSAIVDRVQTLQPKRLDELCCEAMSRRMELASPAVLAKCSDKLKCRIMKGIGNRRLLYGDLFRALAAGNALLADWDLRYAVNLRSADVISVLDDVRATAVTLDLTACECLDDRAFRRIFEAPMPHLQKLCVDSLDEVRGDALAEFGAAHLPKLRTFSSVGCKRLRQPAFAAIMGLPELRTLDAGQCSGFAFWSPPTLPRLDGAAREPRRCTFPPRETLVRLSLASCTRVTTGSLVDFLERGAPALRHLDVSHTEVEADDVLRAVARHAPCLEDLNLCRTAEESCTDAGIDALASSRCAVHLKALNLDGADDITDRALVALRKACKALRSLYVSECRGLSEAGLTTMARELPRLSSMSMRNTAISRSGQFRLVGLLHSRPARGTSPR